jgi:hypothetical protein
VVSDPNCPICGSEAETVYHVPWDCSSARDVWGASDRFFSFQKSTLQGPKFILVAKGIIRNYGKLGRQFGSAQGTVFGYVIT